jgi:hypothetical protein
VARGTNSKERMRGLSEPIAGSVIADRAEARTARSWPWILAAAAAFTLLNAVKPLTQDDTAYYYYAAHIAEDPANPYAFTLFFNELGPEPATQVLAPLALPYWWALGIKLFGDNPFLWKMWLLPISLLFASSLWSLFRRSAPGWELPLLCATVFSPTFLPSLNLMLDVPSLAIGLSGLAVFLRACDRNSARLAACAGALIGIAMQTKYSALVAPAIVLWAALVYSRIRLGVISVFVSGVLFVSWELYLIVSGGTSHFLYHASHSDLVLGGKVFLAKALLNTLGAVTPWITVIGLVGLRVPRRALLAVASVLLLAQILFILLPEAWLVYAETGRTEGGGGSGPIAWVVSLLEHSVWRRLKPINLSFALGGLLVAGVVAALFMRSCAKAFWKQAAGTSSSAQARDQLFLAGWLVLELVGYFALSPFPAMRRVMGLVVVITMLCGSAAASNLRRGRPLVVWGPALANVVLGFCFYGLDCISCFATVATVARSMALVNAVAPGAPVWHDGMWGFQFHAERAGAVRLAVDQSELLRGDYLIAPEDSTVNWARPRYQEKLEIVGRVVIRSPVRFRREFYGGAFPIVSGSDAAQGATVYRVKSSFCVSSNDLRGQSGERSAGPECARSQGY